MKISIVYSKPTFNAEHRKKLDGLGDCKVIDAKNLSSQETIEAIRDSEFLRFNSHFVWGKTIIYCIIKRLYINFLF